MSRAKGCLLLSILATLFYVRSVYGDSAQVITTGGSRSSGDGDTQTNGTGIAATGGPGGGSGGPDAGLSDDDDGLTRRQRRRRNRRNRNNDDDDDDSRDAPRGEPERSQGSPDTASDDIPACRGAADWQCCDVQEFTTSGDTTYCGCSDNFRAGNAEDFCRWRKVQSNPIVFAETGDNVPNSLRFCRCPNSGYKHCEGLTRRNCCDSYGGNSQCNCSTRGGVSTCEFLRVSENPLVWEDQFVVRGRRCQCP